MNLSETLIRQYIHLDRPNTKGWHPVLCRICNDHGKKGKRAAFLFTETGCSYNCFNCGHTAIYEPSQEYITVSPEMIQVFESFNIPEHEWKKLTLDALLNAKDGQHKQQIQQIEPTEISLLPFFYQLVDDKNDDWCQYSIEYLTSRLIDWKSQPFFCVKQTNHPDNKKWYGRLIIPIYKNNKLIYYQGRDLTDLHQKKYLNSMTPRDCVLYGYDHLLSHSRDPLYVTEGWFDAYNLKGVAVLGNKLTQQQITWLNKTSRQKVIIPDRYGDGILLAKQAIQLGWAISILDKEDVCKDVNESMCKRGQLYTLKTLTDNTFTDNVSATTMINMYCEK